uniref:Uncharacterized protein n=1 Tax=Romanomermis culicivorax TaxID=13658 RepID=A0A915KM72_ROMCU
MTQNRTLIAPPVLRCRICAVLYASKEKVYQKQLPGGPARTSGAHGPGAVFIRDAKSIYRPKTGLHSDWAIF